MYDSYPVNFKFKEPTLLLGRFTGNGTGALSAVTNTSKGMSVARTNVGALTITLTDTPVGIIQNQEAWVCSPSADKNVRVTPPSAGATTLTLQVTLMSNGAAVDLTSSEELNVQVWTARTQVP